jgi:hypothetical protein
METNNLILIILPPAEEPEKVDSHSPIWFSFVRGLFDNKDYGRR